MGIRFSAIKRGALIVVASCAACLAVAAPALGAEDEAPKKASFAPVAEKTAGQAITCGSLCTLRDLLFAADQTLSIAVRKVGPPEAVEPTGQRVVLQRQPGGSVEVIHEKEDVKFEAGDDTGTQDRFTIDLSDLDEPGEYIGALLFDLSNGADQVSIPVTVKVKEGPLCALLLLIVSVFLGWLIRWLLDRRPAAKFRRDARELRIKISGLPDDEQAILAPLWNSVWGRRKKDLTSAETQLKSLTAGIEALRVCRGVQDEARRSPQASRLIPWQQRIGSARAQLAKAVQSLEAAYESKVAAVMTAKREFDGAARAMTEVEGLRERARAADTDGDPYKAFKAASEKFQKAIDETSPKASDEAPDLEPLVASARTAFVGLGLHEEESDEKAYARLAFEAPAADRPERREAAPPEEMDEGGTALFDVKAAIGASLGTAAGIAVMLVVLAVGFKITYLDNATFGANLTDWLTLVFWGLAAYGTRQTLTGLGPTPAKS